LVKAFLVYVVYLIIFLINTPQNIWKFALQFGSSAPEIYYGYLTIKPNLLPLATKSSLLMLLAVIFPCGSVCVLDLMHRYRIKKQQNHFSMTRKETNTKEEKQEKPTWHKIQE